VDIGTTYTADRGIRVTGSYPNIQLYSNHNTANARNWAIINPWNDWGQLEFRVSNSQNGDPLNSGTSALVMSRGGNIGIGTISPGVLLHVKGSYEIARLETTSSAGTGANYLGFKRGSTLMGFAGFTGSSDDFDAGNSLPGNFRFWTNNLERMRIDSTGNVGIGTASPGFKLEVRSTITGQAAYIRSDATTGTNYGLDAEAMGSATTNIGGYFAAANAANNYAIIVPPGFGNVGIGTTTPTQKLSVAGNINVIASATEPGNITLSGTLNAKYQDVAEWVPSLEKISTGTVVVLDPTKSNQVISSTQAYDTRVAGVVSEKPGIALGESGANKVLVATTGRVLVKVDASNGPIYIGDLLVTSDMRGVAMKSTPVSLSGIQLHRPGTLIGKALEPMEKGSGRILVLLSLQ
jgi:hypothetical protein